ncbi:MULTISPECIES: polysaccharide pyruvyl transferase family protein [unclassified Bacillus (in: firmicutes)]|uniref:polysaccharide pyruvyl transferase family protein n=1 Tax=unclassified Bacillus (in: firmicutes) TaxID=185979 RepID=UPI00227E61B3|nr:polysaccharide pyruvyl transferase family protein [Bacillus sp. S10C12M]
MTVQEIKGKKLVKGIAPNVEPEALLNDKRKVFLFGSPSYTNIGDQAIAYAEEKFIKNRFPYYEYIEIMDYATDEGIELVKEIIREDDIVCFTGGGNLGNLYLDIEEDRRKVFSAFKDYKSISLPQSVYFEDTEEGNKEKKKTQDAYHQNPNLTIAARETQTLDVVKETFDSNVIFTPDMVLSLDIVPKEIERDGVLFILRADKEKVTDEDFISQMMKWAEKTTYAERTDTVLDTVDTIDYADREKHFMEMLDRIGSSKLVITDRLHAMIFSIITKTPCLVFGNSYGKAKHSYRDWLESLNFIEYTDKNDVEELERMIDRLLQAEPNDVDLSKDFQPLVDFFAS